ncbi:hypothetical protein MTO96_021120 [Rhipicephalus appendiculatus]
MDHLVRSVGCAGAAASTATTHLRGRGRRWSGSSDQRSREQTIPLLSMGVMPVPDSPSPSYPEAMHTANRQVSSTDNDVAPTATNHGDVRQLERDLYRGRRDRRVEHSGGHESREHFEWRRRRCIYVVMFILGVFVGIALYATLMRNVTGF